MQWFLFWSCMELSRYTACHIIVTFLFKLYETGSLPFICIKGVTEVMENTNQDEIHMVYLEEIILI